MKTIIKLSLLAIVALFASCATTDISIVKRKYNNGYYVDINNHKKVSASVNKTHTLTPDLNIEKEFATQKIDNDNLDETYPLTASSDKGVFVNPVKTKNNFTKKPVQKTLSESVASADLNNNQEIKKVSVAKKAKTWISKALSDAETNKTILLVILSLFPILALIAIYVKDGKKITTNFWVDLLLHLPFIAITTSWGRIVVALYAIYAVLVVLDVFSLA